MPLLALFIGCSDDDKDTIINPDITPPAAIADLAIDSTSEGMVCLSWTAVGDDGNTGTASSYEIHYCTDSANLVDWSSTSTCFIPSKPSESGSIEKVNINVYCEDLIFYFAIKVKDNEGNISDISNIAKIGTVPDFKVAVADPRFNAMVQDYLGIQKDTMCCSDFLQLDTLKLNVKNISDITGLENAKNLEVLSLYTNDISDITPLTGLDEH